MIPAKPNTRLTYTPEYGRRVHAVCADVVAWSEDGCPMVLGQRGLIEVSALCVESIEIVSESEFESFVQFTPVPDLYALHREETGELFEHRLIGWGVTGNGDIVPVSEEADNGIIAASRDSTYIVAFRADDRAKVYAEHSKAGSGWQGPEWVEASAPDTNRNPSKVG